SGCPAREGEHRDLAVLGHSEACVATHPSDMAVALAALDAVVHVRGAASERALAVTDLHRLPGEAPERDTTLDPGDLIVAIELPPAAPPAQRYRKVRERASFSFAVVSVAVAVEVSEGVVREAKIALGGVAHAPWRARRAEAALRGAPATEESFARAAEEELARARPLRDNAFKVPLARNVLIRTLVEATA
ncbi:MAG TPA: FAD binding domain-containing protein, partial [Gemmatimonadaceae bacterium]|nr:FAD binding domain-containing protein [Gemmatimonadaceae bacterium]